MQIKSIGCALAALLSSVAHSAAPSDASANAPRVALATRLGTIEIEVYPDRAPLSACDFLAYVADGLYESATFYRVVRLDNDRGTPKIEVVQGGLLDDRRARAPIPHETTQQTGLTHRDGTVSLARAAVGTGSAAAFFIVIGDQPSLDYGGTRNADKQGFAAFGRVVRGMDVVRRIHRMPADAATDEPYLAGQLLSEPVAITGAKILVASPTCDMPSK
jgi:peptidyl-prolyl cis-trans isomerase A (cyclophilin A)